LTGVPRSQRLLAFSFTAAGPSAVWTSPDGFITLVKSAAFSNTGTLVANVNVILGVAGGGLAISVFHAAVDPSTAVQWDGWHALNPGDVVYGFSDQATVACWISGAVLAGSPQFPPAVREVPQVLPDITPRPRRR
jgi:hypothetical protein